MIPVAKPSLGKEELNNVIQAVKEGWISSKGKFVQEFERRFPNYLGVKHGVATSNGTVALHLALEALDIGPRDEVIIPTLTFIATANSVAYTGAKPIFVDSHPNYWCIDPEKIEKHITPRTKAIIPVHLYGHPSEMDKLIEIAEAHGLFVIEDAAEAHGSEYKKKKVGSFGDIACFSFYGNKIVTTGEGGMCVTSNEKLADKMRILRDHGEDPNRKYWYNVVGFNYRMTNLQAAIGVAQLEKLDKFIEKKTKIAKFYNELLKDVKGISLPPEEPWAKNVYWMYSVLVNDDYSLTRDELIEEYRQRHIETRPFFNPIHTMPPYKSGESHPVAEELSKKGINLPSFTELSKEEIERIAEIIRRNE
jgi:perosamine synthetase